MARFIVRRLVGMVAVLFAVSVIVFLIFNVIPNSEPGRSGSRARTPTPTLIARVNDGMGLRRARCRCST